MNNPAAFAVERPRVIGLAVIFAFVYGFLTYVDIPRQENPTITNRHIAVETYLPGAEPEKVELLVSKVLEDKISEVDDIHNIFSNSIEGASFVRVEIKKDAPIEKRLQQIRLKIQEARLLLPPQASEPDVDDRVLRTNTMVLALASDEIPAVTLKEHAKELKRRLEGIPTIGKVELLGEAQEEIEVAVDVTALAHQGISLPEIVRVLAERNALLPGGELQLGQSRSTIRATGLFEDVGEIVATYIGSNALGVPVRLADVATVRRQLAEDQIRVRYRGTPAVALALEMLPNHNVVALGAQVRTFIADFDAQIGADLTTRVVADEPAYVQQRVDQLSRNLFLGLALVIAFTFVGLGWRSGFVVSLTIPVSMVIALGLMGTFGVPLHQISIAALVIAIGLVVDESIVVVDNIQRHIDMGKPAKQAAVDGLGEIHLAVLAGAATTVAAFVPLMLMTGDIGDFIRAIPIAVTLMLIASVCVAHFFTPLLLAFVHGWEKSAASSKAKGSPVTNNVIPLAQIADLVPGFTNQQILRWRRKREAFVGLDVSGRSLFAVAADVERQVTDLVSVPEGYDISFFGQQAEVTESFASMARAAVIAVFLIYIVLVIRFRSLAQPILIILAIPMALIGSTLGLVLSSNPLSFTAFLGMISLTGIVVNDSIVLLDYINTLRKRGVALADAVVQGASTRLRAVTLTSITTIAGLLPLSLAGGDFFGPFGFAMIGGLAASTVLTLVVQPAAYLALERRLGRTWPAPDAGSGHDQRDRQKEI